MTFRPPLITRQEPVKRAPELQQSNLLETTLRSKDALPFRQQDWPNPRGPEFPSILRTWIDSYKLMLIGKDKFPNRQSDWPNPRGPEFSVALRTWTDSYKLGLIGKDALPTRQRDWPNPKAPGIDTRSDQQSTNLALSQVVVQAPFSSRDWPNPRAAQVPVIQQQDTNLALRQIVSPPFSLADWPNPRTPVGWMQWDGTQNILPLTTPTPTPTPTPDQAPVEGGGIPRRRRRYIFPDGTQVLATTNEAIGLIEQFARMRKPEPQENNRARPKFVRIPAAELESIVEWKQATDTADELIKPVLPSNIFFTPDQKQFAQAIARLKRKIDDEEAIFALMM